MTIAVATAAATTAAATATTTTANTISSRVEGTHGPISIRGRQAYRLASGRLTIVDKMTSWTVRTEAGCMESAAKFCFVLWVPS